MDNDLVEMTNKDVVEGFKGVLLINMLESEKNIIDKFTEELLDGFSKDMIDRKIMSLRNVYIFVGQSMGIDLSKDKVLEEYASKIEIEVC